MCEVFPITHWLLEIIVSEFFRFSSPQAVKYSAIKHHRLRCVAEDFRCQTLAVLRNLFRRWLSIRPKPQHSQQDLPQLLRWRGFKLLNEI